MPAPMADPKMLNNETLLRQARTNFWFEVSGRVSEARLGNIRDRPASRSNIPFSDCAGMGLAVDCDCEGASGNLDAEESCCAMPGTAEITSIIATIKMARVRQRPKPKPHSS